MSTRLGIVNAALIKMGEPKQEDLDTYPASEVDSRYEALRDWLLRRYRWNFAMTRAKLEAETEEDGEEFVSPAFGFTYRFAVPEDMGRFVGIYNEFGPLQNYTDSAEPYKIEGGFILADIQPLYCFYVRGDVEPEEFDASFTELLTCLLASDTCYRINANEKLATRLFNEAQYLLDVAKRASAVETGAEYIQSSVWLDSRYPYALDLWGWCQSRR